MSWAWVKRWLQNRRRKSRHKEANMVDTESGHQRADILSKPSERYPSVFVKDYGYLPLIVTNAAHVIEKNIRAKGLFRTKGTASIVTRKLMISSKNSSLKDINVHDAVEALKTFLVSLPDPLVPDHVLEALIRVPKRNRSSQYIIVLREFRRYSPYNFAILHFVVNLLSKVSKHALHNGVDVHKLAVILVCDVIRPLIGENSETRVNVGDLIQRLPFLIMVMETLIENPDIFKMAAAFSDEHEGPETGQHGEEVKPVTKEPSTVELVASTCKPEPSYAHPLAIEARKSSVTPTLNESVGVVDEIQPASQEAPGTSTIVSAAETDAVILKDAVLGTEGNIQCSPSPSSLAALAPFFNKERSLMVAADSECSTRREGILKASICKSSPSKKPLRTSRPKKAAVNRRQKNRKLCGINQCAREVVAAKSSDSSLNSDYGTSLLQGEISGSSEKTCGTDGTNSLMAQPLGCHQVLAVQAPDQNELEDREECEHVADKAFGAPQTSAIEQDSGTGNRGYPLNLIHDSRETVNTTEDPLTQKETVAANTDSKVLGVPRKGVKCRRKGKLPLKKNHKRLADLKSRSQANRVRCFSISPLPLMNRDARLFLERISKTSSCVTFSPSTEDNHKAGPGASINGSAVANSQDCTDTGCRKPLHLSLASTTACENTSRHSAFTSVSGCRARHSARSSALVRDNTRNSDKASDSGRTYSSNSAQSCMSENDQEQSSISQAEKGKSSSASIGNDSRVRKKSPFMESMLYKTNTPKDLQQIIIVKVINDRNRAFPRARLRGTRNKPLVGAQKLKSEAHSERSSIGSSLENIFLMSITLFIISLVLYHLSNSSHEEEWSE